MNLFPNAIPFHLQAARLKSGPPVFYAREESAGKKAPAFIGRRGLVFIRGSSTAQRPYFSRGKRMAAWAAASRAMGTR